jgi:hypothetical protein
MATRGKAYRCGLCLEKGGNYVDIKSRVESHIFKVHLTLDQSAFYCTLCLFRCKNNRDLTNHVRGFRPHLQRKKALEDIGHMQEESTYLFQSQKPYVIKDTDMVSFSRAESLTIWRHRSALAQRDPPPYVPTPLDMLPAATRRTLPSATITSSAAALPAALVALPQPLHVGATRRTLPSATITSSATALPAALVALPPHINVAAPSTLPPHINVAAPSTLTLPPHINVAAPSTLTMPPHINVAAPSTLPPHINVAAPPIFTMPPPTLLTAPPTLAQPLPYQFGVTGVDTTARRSRFAEPSHGFTVPQLPLPTLPTPTLDIVQEAMGEISENILDGLIGYDEVSLANELPDDLMVSPLMYPPSSPADTVTSELSVASPYRASSPYPAAAPAQTAARDVAITTQVAALLNTTTAHITAALDRNTQAMDAFARILEEHSAIFENLQKEKEKEKEKGKDERREMGARTMDGRSRRRSRSRSRDRGTKRQSRDRPSPRQ